jgi:hypothetical protein
MYIDTRIAATHQASRLAEAESLRRGHHLVLARRKARRERRAALQARLVLARSL